MTRKDYIKLAAALRTNYAPIANTDPVRDAIHSDYCDAIAGVLAADNPNFDRGRFLAACGVES